MKSYRTNLTEILRQIQTLYQNGFVTDAQKNKLVKSARGCLYDEISLVDFRNDVKRLSRRMQSPLGATACERILNMLETQYKMGEENGTEQFVI